MSLNTIQKKILSDRQGSYGPEDEILFNITPSDVAVLVGKNSYFKCEFTIAQIAEGSDYGKVKASLDSFGGGGYSLFDRVQIWSGNGATLLESCEEVPAWMGTSNFYDKTRGLNNQRNLLEGLNNNDGTVPDNAFSPYYGMVPNTGNAHYKKVELILPLRFSGIFYGKVFPCIATQGLQVRILLNSAAKALKADLCDGFVVQRSRQGQLPQMCDLPWNSAKPTTGATFTGAINPIVGPVSQQLPKLWELAAGTNAHGVLKLDPLTGTMPTLTAATAGTYALTQAAGQITTTGSGTGVGLSVVVAAGTPPTITSMTVTAAGTGYEESDQLTIVAGHLGAGSSASTPYTLVTGDFDTTNHLTSVKVKKTDAVGGAVGVPSTTQAWATTTGAAGGPAAMPSNVYAADDTFCNMIGQRFYGVNSAGDLIDFTGAGGIQAVNCTNADYIEVSWTTPTPDSGTFTVADHCPLFGAILDPNVVGAPHAHATQAVTYQVTNAQLVCESLADDAYVQSMMKRVASEGGLTLDIKTYNVHRQNLFKNQAVSQQLIPTTEYRAKCLLEHQQIPTETLGFSYWRPVADYLRDYQYMIKDKNTPNRKVPTGKEYSPDQNAWNVRCDNERTKTLRAAGIKVRRETHPSARFVFGRELAKKGYSFNANRNQCRLTQDWGLTLNTGGSTVQNVLPQHDKLLLTFVPHFRKITIQNNNVVVAY